MEVLAKTAGYIDQLVKEAIEIRLNLNNINREEGFKLSQAWNLAIKILQSNDPDSTNNTTRGRFQDGQEKRQANIEHGREDYARG
jgi:hypothetical protein